jgi:predicted DNA-binding WGR domain protein
MGYNGPPPKGAKPVGHVPPPPPMSQSTIANTHLADMHLPPDSFTSEYFECRTGGHFKFWRVAYPAHWASTGVWRVTWGRIGTAGQQKTFNAGNCGNARAAAQAKIGEKKGKGYVFVSRSLAVGQDAGSPSPAFKAQQAAKKPLLAMPEPAQAPANVAGLSDAQRSAIISLHQSGMDAGTIATTLHLRKQQVAAVVAHVTMGTYGGKPAAASAPAGDPTGKRKFDWSE